MNRHLMKLRNAGLFAPWFEDQSNFWDFGEFFEGPLQFDALHSDWVDDTEEYKFETHLPGLNNKDIKIECESGSLMISVDKSIEDRAIELYFKSLDIPMDADREKIAAVYETGTLKVCIPKKFRLT